MKPKALFLGPRPVLLSIFLLNLNLAAPQAAPPVVSNVRCSQRAGTGLIDIYYDVADAGGNQLAITVQVSNNAGVSYNTTGARSFSGDLGQNITPGNNKHVIWDAGADWDPVYFPNVRVKVTADDGFDTAPPEMRYIPEGSFSMGDNYGEGGTSERPTHAVFVSGFYMDKYEVTKGLWDEVYTWAVGHGYSFDNPGRGQAANHPVQTVNWYDVVKWCNARSEMRGLAPVYYTDTAQTTVYRTGRSGLSASAVKWTANGYRLPTEAEWEKAARGGLAGHHFPWPSLGGNYADHFNGSKANYWQSGDPFEGNTVPTTPVGYSNGSQTPAGTDMANGYGLYDMAGNVWEW
ncbi:MAG: SUMF1/EgtB/PvdO family nonheme iron enzyme [Chloroflexi bacterium]|nr:SUMF1/EgtB/PvdO family nonheme iron enzyme [Chloroflexota bacterium]